MSFGTSFEAQQNAGIVVNESSWDEAGQVRLYCLQPQPGDEAREVESMDADVTDRTRGACSSWVGSPLSAPRSLVFNVFGEPLLQILNGNEPYSTETPRGTHCSGLANQWIASIVIRHRQKFPIIRRGGHQHARLLRR